jgi:hypothetical protein
VTARSVVADDPQPGTKAGMGWSRSTMDRTLALTGSSTPEACGHISDRLARATSFQLDLEFVAPDA